MKMLIYCLMGCLFWIDVLTAEPLIYEKQYSEFKVWLDCEENGPVMVYYELDMDTGNLARGTHNFKVDPEVPSECQYRSGDSFGSEYDRGHLVPANHMDHSQQAMEESFYITNMLPQEKSLNRYGAWRHTENISECYRDITPLRIWAGVVYGDHKENDLFVESHGIETPDFWWKLIYRSDTNEYVAWYFPNSKRASRARIDDYMISKEELKLKLDYVPDFGIGDDAKSVDMDVSGNSNQLQCEGITTSGG